MSLSRSCRTPSLRGFAAVLVFMSSALGEAAAQACPAGATVTDCASSPVPATAAHREHLLLQLAPILRQSRAEEKASANGEKLVDQHTLSTTADVPVATDQQAFMDQQEPSGGVHAEVALLSAHKNSCQSSFISRRRRGYHMCTCRRRSNPIGRWNPREDKGTGRWCQGNRMVGAVQPSHHRRIQSQDEGGQGCSSCLCVFDIDRTLTGKQEDTWQCPRNKVLPFYDAGYGGGSATLSELSAKGIAATSCNECYLGITSAGHGSGDQSQWNRYILDNIMRSERHDAFVAAHPETKQWSHGTDVHSPYVLGQPNKEKQEAVDLIRKWYGAPQRGVCIRPENVFFFGDRTENIAPFQQKGFNSLEISCASRDPKLHHGGVGYCGATPQEVKRESGNILCR